MILLAAPHPIWIGMDSEPDREERENMYRGIFSFLGHRVQS
jgi:hypothetical protein